MLVVCLATVIASSQALAIGVTARFGPGAGPSWRRANVAEN